MAAVGTEDVVILAQGVNRPNSYCLLANVQMRTAPEKLLRQ